jgi:hypothetical protein
MEGSARGVKSSRREGTNILANCGRVVRAKRGRAAQVEVAKFKAALRILLTGSLAHFSFPRTCGTPLGYLPVLHLGSLAKKWVQRGNASSSAFLPLSPASRARTSFEPLRIVAHRVDA